jgi:hypothetical protein
MARKFTRRTFPVTVITAPWKVVFYHPDTYEKRVGDDSEGVCDDEAKVISLNLRYLNPSLIRHELTHAFLFEMSFIRLQLAPDQQEEFFCELNAKHGQTLVELADKIYSIGQGIQWKKTDS